MMRPHSIVLWLCLAGASSALGQGDPPVPKVGNPHGGMELDCKLCHAENSWVVAGEGGFDHATTGFPLEGRHRQALCRDCHREPVFAHVGSQCADCHTDSHRGRLGPACNDCHAPTAWVDQARMRQEHNATALPLVGAHERVDCDACHFGAASGDYVGTPNACIACHAEAYEATTSPAHEAANFGPDCERCHGVFSSSWGSGDFIHAPGFPLTGAHRLISCTDCHSTGFAGTPTACAVCHQADYDNTTDPIHLNSGFPISCQDCHTTNAWEPSTWDHDTLFPIYSGAHRDTWTSCAECHVVPTNYATFECILCHEHNRTDMDDKHREERDYEYLSTACLQCHPRGKH